MRKLLKRSAATVGMIVMLASVSLHAETALAMGPNVIFTPASGDALMQFEIKGTGFHPGERVFINWDHPAAPLGQVTADNAGEFVTTVTVPDASTQGDHKVTLAGDLGSVAQHLFKVGSASPAAPVTTAVDKDNDDENGSKPLLLGIGGLVVGLLAGAGLRSMVGRKA